MFKHKQLLALLFSLLIGSGLFAQTLKPVQTLIDQAHKNGTSFFPIHLFQQTNTLDSSAARFAQQAQFLLLQPELLRALFSAQPQAISLVLPYNGQFLLVDLVRVDLGVGAQNMLISGQSSAMHPVYPGLHYRGVLHGSRESLAAFSFFEEEVFGFISDARFNNLVLGRVQTPRNVQGYMLYSDLELAMDNPFECSLLERQIDQKIDWNKTKKARQGSVKPVRIALEADFSLLQNRGGRQAVAHYLSALFNQLAAVFANEDIALTLSQLIVPEAPMYDHTSGNVSLLKQVVENHKERAFDLIQLVGHNQENPESVSYLNSLCTSEFRAAYCALEPAFSNVPTHSWALSNLAHELGHQFGARHTQWCGWPGGALETCSSGLEGNCTQPKVTGTGAASTLMSYCQLNGAPAPFFGGFGHLPGQLIRESVNTAPCRQHTQAYAASDRSSNTLREDQFSLAPNPATHQVTVVLNIENQIVNRIVVLDLLGRPALVREIHDQTDAVTLDLSGISKGIYLVQVFESENLLATRRLIKE